MLKVEQVYNQLSKFEYTLKRLFSNVSTYPIHKKLQFAKKENTKAYTDINEWIADHFKISTNAQILDAGCGVGNTLLYFCQNTQRRGLGISLSSNEINIAQKAATKMNLSKQCQFRCQSFDEKFSQQFDLIIAIESLKHSRDISQTLQHLAQQLKPKGQIIIVEDFPSKEIPEDQYLKDFKNYWSLTALYSQDQFEQALKKAGLQKIVDQNFTDLVPYKSSEDCIQQYQRSTKRNKYLFFSSAKNVNAIFTGGIVLDYYYSKDWMQYKLIGFQKMD